MRPAVYTNGPHQRTETVVTAAFAKSFADFPCNNAWAEISLDANANIFKTTAKTARPVAHFGEGRIGVEGLEKSSLGFFFCCMVALGFGATSDPGLNVVYNVGYLATVQTICLIG